MTFVVNGIKQEKDVSTKIAFLVVDASADTIREFLQQIGIIILSIKESEQTKESYGPIFLKINYENKNIEIITKFDDIQEACIAFLSLWFDVIDINTFAAPLWRPQVQEIIHTSRIKVLEQQQALEMQNQQEQTKQTAKFVDEDLETAKKLIDKVFAKVDEAVQRSDGNLSVQELRDIKNMEEELKKLRMWTNLEKIREIMHKLFVIVERLNTAYYRQIANPQDRIFEDSILTNTDLQKEFEQLENVKMQKLLGLPISIKNQDYSWIGLPAIYRKCLQKDLLSMLLNIQNLIYNFYDLIEIIFLIMGGWLGIYVVMNQLFMFANNSDALAYSLMKIGVFWFVLTIIRYFRKPNATRLIFLILLLMLGYYLLLWLIRTNFAL